MTKFNREETYLKSSKERQKDIVRFSSSVAEAIGVDFPAAYLDALNKALDTIQFIKIFLEEIFFTVVVVLALLAMVLVYSLLLSDVEEKTFEYGMLRTLGLQLQSLVGVLFAQVCWGFTALLMN